MAILVGTSTIYGYYNCHTGHYHYLSHYSLFQLSFTRCTILRKKKKKGTDLFFQLVEDLWDTIATVPSGSQGALKLSRTELAELDRRRDAHRANPATGVPWEKVRSKLFRG